MFSDNVDLQRSASLTFAEITERGTFTLSGWIPFLDRRRVEVGILASVLECYLPVVCPAKIWQGLAAV